MSKIFTGDFETSTPEWYEIDKEARVWAYALCEIGNTDNFIYGNNLDDFMKFCSGKENYRILFHNLKFDGQYIISAGHSARWHWLCRPPVSRCPTSSSGR